MALVWEPDGMPGSGGAISVAAGGRATGGRAGTEGRSGGAPPPRAHRCPQELKVAGRPRACSTAARIAFQSVIPYQKTVQRSSFMAPSELAK